MSQQSDQSTKSAFFDLTVDGVGYLNRVRAVKPKKGAEFLACTVAAMRGNVGDLGYTKFDCRVSGADAKKIVQLLEADVTADRTVLVGFRIADIYPETFVFEKGEKKGQTGVSLKGRLLRIKFARVNGEPVTLPTPTSANGEDDTDA
jgi:hypothetical protein